MDKKKIIYSILKELNDGNRELKSSDFEINLETFGEIIEMLTRKELISGANVVRAGQGNKVQYILLQNAVVDIDGIEYLEKNSVWAKGYRGIKEIASWIPGIG